MGSATVEFPWQLCDGAGMAIEVLQGFHEGSVRGPLWLLKFHIGSMMVLQGLFRFHEGITRGLWGYQGSVSVPCWSHVAFIESSTTPNCYTRSLHPLTSPKPTPTQLFINYVSVNVHNIYNLTHFEDSMWIHWESTCILTNFAWLERGRLNLQRYKFWVDSWGIFMDSHGDNEDLAV